MLTSSHYLLGGFLAVSCAIGALIPPPISSDSYLPQPRFKAPTDEAIDISYRGSGRLSDQPAPKKKVSGSFPSRKHVIAHRGSGRVRPSSI